VPKGPDIPAPPAAALQVQQDHPLSHQLTAEFAAAFSRDYFVETVSLAPAAPYVTEADLTGDGEIPAAGNNNRATRTVEDDLQNFADVVVTGSPLDLENPLLRFKEQVTTFFLVNNRSQSVAARNIAQKVERIAQGSEENSAAVAQTAASAERLERLASELASLAARFRIA
jgi:hypothetical protein